ncbi:Phosphate metabolism transcription protein [Vermiconidia calcicola]|uniref:Phosphate metabolism transcription protein n=1 Tax=Vermiconidia calcicola TaxID=1690605 RepID=A0ACC3MXD0_9PEZI|nr:Phosphate metabolism transcription protein [Vermiconidia calcicola]
MRFGKTLQISVYSPWRDNYIDYSKLKKLLREDESSNPSSPSTEGPTKDNWTDEDEGAFVDELVNVQLEKVHAFHKETYEKLRDRTAKCEARLDGVAVSDKQGDQKREGVEEQDRAASSNGNGKRPVQSEEEKQKVLQEVLKELDQITQETNELEKYSRINYAGFLKAAKKHDRKRGGSYRVRPLLQVRLSALPFNKEDYSPLLYRLSAMYSFVRQHLHARTSSDSLSASDVRRGLSMSETHPGKEEYISHKFWVHPENLLEVKTMILRRLPVLVYNPQTSRIAEGSTPDPSITSIYFDNPAFSLYTKKVDIGEASSLRLRWYGQLESRPKIWVEKKTVQHQVEGEQSPVSWEARLTTKEKYVQRFVKGEYHMEKQIQKLADRAGAESEEVQSFKSSVQEVQDFIKENDLQPVLRANYTRTAFQIPGDDRVRVSLDTDLAFIREDALDRDRPCRDPETWHRTDIDNSQLEYPFSSIRKGEITRFPFALLEIKIRNDAKGRKSEWIGDIMNSHLVKEAPRFSKFVHGVAQLFEDYVNTFPFWLSEMEVDIRRDPQQAFEEEQARKRKEVEDEVAVGSLLRDKGSMMHDHGSKPRDAVISPVGSPTMTGDDKYSPQTSFAARNASNLGNSFATSFPNQQDSVVEEPDDDETGEQMHGTAPGGSYGTMPTTNDSSNHGVNKLKNLLPTFSTSKYAAHRRSKTQLPPGVTKPTHWLKDAGPVQVEGKVWLANQRTFIKWQHVSVLLASLSLGLYNAAGENNNIARALAVVYTLVAVFAGLWGYGVYMWRTSLIQRRSGKDFDARLGPCVVCVGLVVALGLNFGFKYSQVMEDRRNSLAAGAAGALAMNQSSTGFGEMLVESVHNELRV